MVLVSGYLDGENAAALRVEVETMQFVAQGRGNEAVGSPQTPVRTKFGVPKRYYLFALWRPLLTVLQQIQGAKRYSSKRIKV